MISTGGTPVTCCCTGWMEHPEKVTESSGRTDLAAWAQKAWGALARAVSLPVFLLAIAAPPPPRAENTRVAAGRMSLPHKEVRFVLLCLIRLAQGPLPRCTKGLATAISKSKFLTEVSS